LGYILQVGIKSDKFCEVLDAWGLLHFEKVVLLDVLTEFLINFFPIEFFK
jgi:hypothetical protein